MIRMQWERTRPLWLPQIVSFFTVFISGAIGCSDRVSTDKERRGTFLPVNTAERPVKGHCGNTPFLVRLLVLDLKSGWFSEDLDLPFTKDLFDGCSPLGSLETDYLHYTRAMVEGVSLTGAGLEAVAPCLQASTRKRWPDWDRFENQVLENRGNPDAAPPQAQAVGTETECELGPLTPYEQIWILSGDEEDLTNIRESSRLFQSMIDQLKARAAEGPLGLYLGAGMSNVTHVNAFAKALGLSASGVFDRNPDIWKGDFATPGLTEFYLPEVLRSLPGEGEPTLGTFRSSFTPLRERAEIYDFGGVNPLAQLSSGEQDFEGYTQPPRCLGDRITLAGATVQARDLCNQAVLASWESDQLKVVLDANLARFYGIDDAFDHIIRTADFLRVMETEP